MVRFNISFNRKLTAVMSERMLAAYDQLAGISACAGIKENADAAFKARVNHHGAFSTKVPARKFIGATRNMEGLDFSTDIRKIIYDALQTPIKRQSRTLSYVNSAGLTTTYTLDMRRDKPFGEAQGRGSMVQRTPNRIMRKIANQVAANQKRAISERAYEAGPTNENDPQNNTPRVAKAKGFNWPLVDTGDMYSAIHGWTE